LRVGEALGVVSELCCKVILRGQLLAQSAKVANADCRYFVWTSVRCVLRGIKTQCYLHQIQKIWEHLNCMLSKTRPEAKVRGRAKKDAGARLGVEGSRSIRRGLTEESNYLRGGCEV